MCRFFCAKGHSCGLCSKDGHISTRSCPSGCSRRLGALAPQPVGPSGQLGKEQTLPDAEDLFSRYGVGFGQSDSTPHAGTDEQDGGTTETVSEAPGAYGSCSVNHATGAAPYEPASTLALWPSLEVGVAARHAPGPSHSGLPPNFLPVVRPFFSLGRSAPGTGLQTCRGLHRCLRQGLGGQVQWACSVGGLDGSPTALAHQLPRVAGSTPGLEPSQETLMRRARTGPYRQHCDCRVHQPTSTRRMSQLARHLFLRSQKHLRSLRAIYIPCSLNRVADELSRAALSIPRWSS